MSEQRDALIKQFSEDFCTGVLQKFSEMGLVVAEQVIFLANVQLNALARSGLSHSEMSRLVYQVTRYVIDQLPGDPGAGLRSQAGWVFHNKSLN